MVLHMWGRCRDNQTDVPQPVIKSTPGCLNLNHMFRSFPELLIQGELEALLSNEAAPGFS